MIKGRLAAAAFCAAMAVALLAAPTPAVGVNGPTGCSQGVSGSASAMVATVLVLLNRDRAALGVAGLRPDYRLMALAMGRARRMAENGTLSHAVAGPEIGQAIRACGVRASLAGEAIGETNAGSGRTAARYLYGLWKHSPEHWGLLVSARFDRIGVGFAYRPGGAATFASIVLAATR